MFVKQRYFEAVGEVDMEPELHIDILDKNWNRLMMAHQERDHAILEEIKRLVGNNVLAKCKNKGVTC